MPAILTLSCDVCHVEGKPLAVSFGHMARIETTMPVTPLLSTDDKPIVWSVGTLGIFCDAHTPDDISIVDTELPRG